MTFQLRPLQLDMRMRAMTALDTRRARQLREVSIYTPPHTTAIELDLQLKARSKAK